MKPLLPALALLLAACASTPVVQYAIEAPAIAPEKKSRTTIEVLEVSLPLYAQGQEIAMADKDGAIRTDASALWADEPARAVSLALAEALSNRSGATVAVEPWPLLDRADARLDVRVKSLVASANGALVMTGQYFLVFENDRRPRSDWFEIAVGLRSATGIDIGAATGIAVDQLAVDIAKNIR